MHVHTHIYTSPCRCTYNYTVRSYSDILVREEVIGAGLGGLGEQGVRLRALVMAIAEREEHMKYDVHV